MKIVLASTSPFRRELLSRLRIPFEAAAPDADETPLPDEMPTEMVKRLARLKAQAVAAQYEGSDALVIGSDQCAVIDGRILGKPGDHARAARQLEEASGRHVVFHTGLCLYDTRSGEAQVEDVVFEVGFRELTAAEIEAYLRAEQPYNCAGSFKSEGLGITLFEYLRGDDPSALIGLPLIRLAAMLRAAGYDPLAHLN